MSLLIKSVRVLVSDKNPEESFDVFINGGKISAIGNFPGKKADEVVDGQGAYIAPGFIDIDTTSDHHLTLFDDPNQEDFLAQGVTTIIGGQCGASLAPLLSGNLKSIRKWADPNSVNVNWHSVAELLYHLDKRPLGVNFGTFAGHGTIRRALTSDALRDLSVRELQTFSQVIEDSVRGGAFGMSTGLSYVHSRGTPYRELVALAGVLKKHNAFYSTHLRRNDEEMPKAIEETLRLTEETGVRTFINHFTPIKGNEKAYEEALGKINAIPPERELYFGIFPVPVTSVALYSFLPEWARGNFEKMAEIVADPANEERLLKGFKDVSGKDFMVAQAQRNDSLVGKTLQDIMKIYSLQSAKKALLKLMQTTKLKSIVHYKNLNSKLLSSAMRSPRSLITSHAPSFGPEKKGYLKSERTTATFTQYLKLSQKENMISMEEAVKKITQIPAKLLNLEGRGEIKEGNLADLTVFKNDEVRCTVVGGEVAWRDGKATGKMKGKILRYAV